MFTDSHCHISKEYYENIDEIVNRAKSAGVTRMIVNADTVKSCYEVLELAKKYDCIYCALGIHPEEVNDNLEELKTIIEDNKDNPKFIAIGEIGLDYYYTKDNKEEQIKLLESQLELAEKYNKPVIIHSREATKDTIDTLAKFPNVIGDIHCFSGSLETANIYLKMGYYIGVGGVLTFKNANIKDVIVKLPMDRILVETDAPYLAPTPKRGEQNEPAYVVYTAEFLANLKGLTLEEISSNTQENVERLFNI